MTAYMFNMWVVMSVCSVSPLPPSTNPVEKQNGDTSVMYSVQQLQIVMCTCEEVLVLALFKGVIARHHYDLLEPFQVCA